MFSQSARRFDNWIGQSRSAVPITVLTGIFLLFLFSTWGLEALASSCSSNAGGPSCLEGRSLGSNQPTETNSHYAGNPVNLITGNKYQASLDFRTADSLLMFKRHYNSINAGFNIGLGYGWRSTYDVSIDIVDRNYLRLIQSDGRIIRFRRSNLSLSDTDAQETNTTSVFKPVDERDGEIIQIHKGFEWSLPDGRQFNFKGPFLIRITSPNGRWVTLFYKNQRLQRVTDDQGRVLRLVYTGGSQNAKELGRYSEESDRVSWRGHLEAIELPDGRRVEYEYDARRQLVNVQYPHKETTGYRYAEGLFDGLLVERLENESMLSQWQYDNSGRVSRFDGVQAGLQLTFDYRNTDVEGSGGSTIVTDHLGTQTEYQWERVQWNSSEENLAGTNIGSVAKDDLVSNGNRPFDETPYKITRAKGPRCIGCPVIAAAEVEATNELQESPEASNPFKLHLTTSSRTKANLLERGIKVLGFDAQGYPSTIQIANAARHSLNPDDDLGIPVGSKFDAVFDTRGQLFQLSDSNAEDETFRFNSPESSNPVLRSRRQIEMLNVALDLEAGTENQLLDGSLFPLFELPDLQPDQSDHSCEISPALTCEDLARADFYLDFAACAYADSNACVVPEGWQRVDPTRAGISNNQDISSFVIVGEFAATIYFNPMEQRVIIAYRGSNGNLLRDYLAGIRIFAGYTEQQAHDAADLAMEIQRIYPNMEIETTGHSLGGGLAVVGAAALDVEGTVFSSFGVARESSNLVGVNSATGPRVDHFFINGDIVVDGPEQFGYDPVRGDNFAMLPPTGENWNGIDAHTHANVAETINFHQRHHECSP